MVPTPGRGVEKTTVQGGEAAAVTVRRLRHEDLGERPALAPVEGPDESNRADGPGQRRQGPSGSAKIVINSQHFAEIEAVNKSTFEAAFQMTNDSPVLADLTCRVGKSAPSEVGRAKE